ncbi:hypothetical protein Fmac_024134 [Flemingia macrophylla]|uniref:MATH domain-containing protein n=1 Tax=Flemingia macrophylla TaxID=520843 RepID=A0ABD1LNH8_9FABA
MFVTGAFTLLKPPLIITKTRLKNILQHDSAKDTLHRFWKKEHDWGWKKFMELSKVYDGFVDTSDNLIIKAQVQVIREKSDRPFRCLDCQYRRELVRVYLTNVEQICRRFVEERRGKLGKLIEDKARWSSGLKALEGQSKSQKGRVKLLDAEEIPAPIVHVEKDMFVLVDDVLLLLERAAIEPLPPKDEKCPQNRTKEAVALKRQEELIREEEAAWQAESEQKAKRGVSEREKKSKKKQAKQKRNNRKGKDKGRDERTTVSVPDKNQDNAGDGKNDSNMEEAQAPTEKPDAMEDVSDVSDSVDVVAETLLPDSEDRDVSPVNWDTDASEVHPPTEARKNGIGGVSAIQNGMSEKRSGSVIDDSSSTCSTDSLPSVVMNDSHKGNSFSNYKVQKSPSRGKNRGKTPSDVGSWTNRIDSQPSGSAVDAGDVNDESGSGKTGESESEVSVLSLQDQLKWAEQHVIIKEEEVLSHKKPGIKDLVERERPNESLQKEKISAVASSPISPSRNLSSVQMKLEHKINSIVDPVHVKKTSSSGSQQTDKDPSSPFTSALSVPAVSAVSKTEIQKTSSARLTERSVAQAPMMSRPSSAPLVSGPRPTAPVVSMVQTVPLLARSVSATGRLGPDPLAATHSHVRQSYRNAIMGNPVVSTTASLTHSSSSSSGVNPSPGYSQASSLLSSQIFLSQSSDRLDTSAGQAGVPFNLTTRDVLQNGPQWIESPQRESSRTMQYDHPSVLNDVQNHDLYRPVHSRSMGKMSLSSEFSTCTSGRQNQGLLVDEFPHLDIINDLLDEEHGIGKTGRASSAFQSLNGPQLLNRQFTCPGDFGANDDLGSSTSSCRFERSRSYHNDHRFQGGYSLSGVHYDPPRDYVPPMSSSVPCVNGQIDGLIPNQWQVASSDLLYLGMRNAENDNYAYYPDYSNMGSGVNGYVFRPSSGS